MRKVTIAVGTAVLAVAHGLPGVAAVGPLRRRFLPALSGTGDPGHVALTFDDGPDPASTPAFLEVLAAHGVQATFFLLGARVAATPRLAAEITAAGHGVGVHGWTHRPPLLTGPARTLGELRLATAVIGAATGQRPRWYRPPHGAASTGSLLAARRLGLTPVLWTADGRDWTHSATGGTVTGRIAAGLRGGGTVLLHDSDVTSAPESWRAALAALPPLLRMCAARGWRVGPLDEHGAHRAQFSRTARSDSRSEDIVANTAVGS